MALSVKNQFNITDLQNVGKFAFVLIVSYCVANQAQITTFLSQYVNPAIVSA